MGRGRKRLSGAKRRDIKKKWKARTFLERDSESSGDEGIVRVDLFNPQQTGMPPATMDELASVTLGSFQLRLVRSYSTSLR